MKKQFSLFALVLVLVISSIAPVNANTNKLLAVLEQNDDEDNSKEKKHKFVRLFPKERQGESWGYNFFTPGSNVENMDMFNTTINGSGSGFIFDILSFRSDMDLVAVGTKHVFLTGGLGFSVMKYRFSDNLKLTYNEDHQRVIAEIDQTEGVEFDNSFFGHDKSKIVYGSMYVPVNLNIKAGGILLSGGGFVDLYLSGKMKRKYKVDGEKVKEKIGNKDFRDFNLNKTKYGWNAEIRILKPGFGIGFMQMITPFFSGDDDPEIFENRIYFIYDIGGKKKK
jgi:hypothetical protein